MAKEKVLIVGGGFGGVKAALELSADNRFEVTLMSDNVNFRYYPTLYHAATGGSYANSSVSLDKMFAGKRIDLYHSRAVTLDRKAKTVTAEDGYVFHYDVLILALGVVTNFFGIKGLEKFAYGIKSIEEVEKLKVHLHKQLTDEHKPDLNYVVVGAGPTGIELSGALMHYLKQIMKHHNIKDRTVHLDLIEAAPRLLPRMPRDTSRAVKRRLKRLGVRLYLNQAVQAATADDLMVNGKPIRSHTVIWTAGVTNNPFFKDNGFALTPRGKVWVDSYLQSEDNLFIVGDNANTPYSGLAQTAVHDGEFVAHNLIRKADGKKFKSYSAHEPITVIPAGHGWAAVIWGKLRLYGWLGWVLRELGDLVGFHDIEGSWPKATEQWLTEFNTHESCPICLEATNK